MVAELCKCGHDLPAHSGTSVSGIPCKVCGVTRSSGWLMGTCTGWEPAGATTTTEPPAGPPDLTHAIQAAKRLREWARGADMALAPFHARDAADLRAGADALEQLQATQDRLAKVEALLRELHERGPTRALHAQITAALDQAAPREDP